MRWRRWWYRRMAWKNDHSLFMDMHPRLAKWIYYRNLFDPVEYWLSSMVSTARRKQTEVALREVGFVEPNGECRTHKWRNPEEVYALANRYRGETP